LDRQPHEGLLLGINFPVIRRVDTVGKVGLHLGDLGLDFLQRHVEVFAQFEFDHDLRAALERLGGDLPDARHAHHGVFHDVGDLGLHDLGAAPSRVSVIWRTGRSTSGKRPMPIRRKLIQPKTISPVISIQAKTGFLMERSERVIEDE